MSVSRGDIVDYSSDKNLLHKVFEDLLNKNESKLEYTAVEDLDKSITFKELNEKSNQIARALLKIVKNDKDLNLISVRFQPNVDLVVTLFGIIKAGCQYVPVACDWPKDRVQYIFSDSKPQLAITNLDKAFLEELDYDIPVISFDELDQKASGNCADNLELERDNQLFAVLYTSGSTGLPKGVRLKHASALARSRWQWRLLPFLGSNRDVCVFKAALTFIDSVTEIFSALLAGKKLVVIPTDVTRNVAKFIDVLEKFNVSRLYLIPSLIQSMLAYISMNGEPRLPKLNHWESTGEALSMNTLKKFYEVFPNDKTLYNIYGGTEMMDNILETFKSYKDALKKCVNGQLPLGRATDNATVYIMDKNTQPSEEGEVGEICIVGNTLADGYVSGDAEIQKKFSVYDGKKLYKTGDFGRIENGRVYYAGRQDTQIKINGKRADLVEIEEIVRETDGVAIALVLALNKNGTSPKIIAFYKVKDDVNLNEVQKNITLKLESRLPNYMMPRLVNVDEFPRLVNGKIDRQGLLNTLKNVAEEKIVFTDDDLTTFLDNSQFESARNILDIITSVIGLSADDKPGLGQSFFEIGGNSLNAVAVLSKLNENGFKVNLDTFFSSKSLLEFINAIVNGESLKNGVSKTFKIRKVLPKDYETCKRIVAKAFYDKEVLTQLDGSTYNQMLDTMGHMFDLIPKDCVIVAADKNDLTVGVHCAMDANLEIDIDEVLAKDTPVARTTERVLTIEEKNIKTLYPDLKDNQVLNSFFLATADHMTDKENIELVSDLEFEMIDIAKKNGYQSIFSLNTSPATQYVARQFGFQVVEVVKVNEMLDLNGERVYKNQNVPDDLVLEAGVKYL